MSLVTTLLLRKPITLPSGTTRTNMMDRSSYGINPAAYAAVCCNNTKTRLANVERVFAQVSAGNQSAIDIADAAGLSLSTAKKALDSLENDPDGARVFHIRNGGRFLYFVTPNAKSEPTSAALSREVGSTAGFGGW